jgi:hypothetical protein
MADHEDVGARPLGQMRRHCAIAVAHVVGDTGQPDRIGAGRERRQHRVRVRDPYQVGHHAAVLDTGQRLHAVVGKHRVLSAVGRASATTRQAPATADLERAEHKLADGHRRGVRSGLYHLGDRLVADGEAVR